MATKKIHMVGIGGIGMSAMARYLRQQGHEVSGCDLHLNETTKELTALGINVLEGHSPAHITSDCSTVIISAALAENHPEVQSGAPPAHQAKIEVVKYAQMLGRILNEAKTGIAVAGSHGKTTTTAMISYILSRAGLQPSFVCGGRILPLEHRNGALGSGAYFVVEACEYDRSFLNLEPTIAVITNIEEDHLDYYKNFDALVDAFGQFTHKVKKDGLLIYNRDDKYAAQVGDHFDGAKESYALAGDADWQAKNIEVQKGLWSFEALKYGKPLTRIQLAIPGEHNVGNALAALALAQRLRIGIEVVQLALSEFSGVQRRFEVLGEKSGVLIIDDYAHHPTEIKATLQAAFARYPDKKLWCVFQPHQHSRTRLLLKDFAQAFDKAHLVILPDIYYARDPQEETKRISSADVARALAARNKAALYLPTFDEVVQFLKTKIEPNTVLMTLGAGNVHEIAQQFLAS